MKNDAQKTQAALAAALFEPKTVALIGASGDPKKNTSRPQRFLRKHGYTGRIVPVNPGRDEIFGEKAYPNLMTVPEVVEHAFIMTLYAKPGYDLARDFAPITLLASTPNILVVHPSVAAKSVQELIALAKAKPGQLNYASSGSGSSAHLAAELFKSMAGVNLTHVPYKGGGPAVTSLVGGETVVGFATAPSVLQQIKSNRLRGLAVTTLKRTAAAPELPTIAESGVPNYDANTWYGALAPAKTAAPIVTRLHAEFIKIMQSADILERIAVLGYEASTTTPQEFAAYIKAEIAKWGKVVKATGIRAD